MTRWVYIAGRGHSGSTMLDAMLGNADRIESVGELISGMTRYSSACSCGCTFQKCPFWSGVRSRFETRSGCGWDTVARQLVSQAHIKWFPKTLFSSRWHDWVNKLKGYSDQIVIAVGRFKKDVVVDSSKELTRALFLLRFVPKSRVIHLVRHPTAILQSDFYRLSVGNGYRILRRQYRPRRFFGPFLLLTCISWVIGNLLCHLLRHFGKDRFLRIRYEDIIAQPIREISRIEKFIGVELDEIKKKVVEGESFKIGHNIGGNKMRMLGAFVLDPNKSIRSGLPRRYSLMASVVCWPLLWAYGYWPARIL